MLPKCANLVVLKYTQPNTKMALKKSQYYANLT